MGSSTQKSTSTTGISNPQVNALLSKLSSGVGSAYQPGGTTYTAPGGNTTSSWEQMISAAGNSDYASGLAGALSSYGNRASGAELGDANPAYAALRQNAINDAITGTTAQFSNSGLFGSDRNVKLASEGAADAALGYDYTNYRNTIADQADAAAMLPQLFQSSMLPSSITGAVGSAQDADAAAKQNGGLDYLAQFMSMLGPLAGASPQTTTSKTPSTPLWQSLLGAGISFL